MGALAGALVSVEVILGERYRRPIARQARISGVAAEAGGDFGSAVRRGRSHSFQRSLRHSKMSVGLRTFVVGGTCPLLYVSSFFCVKRKAVQDKSQLCACLCVRSCASCASCASCGMSICLSKKGGVFHWQSGLLWWALV